MKIYIASSFKLVDRVKEVARELELSDHQITVKWWARMFDIPGERTQIQTTDLKKRYESLDYDDFYSRPECRISFVSDVQGVKEADAFVFVAGDRAKAYNGANVELGIAIGQGIPCFSLGVLEKSVLYYPVTRCENIENLLESLSSLG